MENYRIAGGTDVGVSRQNNEDNLITFDSPIGRVVAVCDGMGGENGGETASSMAVGIIEDIIKSNEFASPNDAIIGSINAANQAVLHRSMMQPQLAGMGSTCVMAIINNGMVYYGSVGDSRIYYYNPNEGLIQLTRDQSYVQTLVDAGEITEEEAENHPRKNEILNAIGLDGMEPATVCDVPLQPAPGSMLLLCSDGLTGMVPNMTIKHVLSRAELSIEDKVQKLINLANEAGGLDNITVQIVEFGKQANRAPMGAPGRGNANGGPMSAAPVAPPKKTKGTSLLLPIIAALIVLGAGFAAWYFLLNKDKKEDVKVENVTPGTNTPSATESKDEPAKAEKADKESKSEGKTNVIVEEKVITKDVKEPNRPKSRDQQITTKKQIQNGSSAIERTINKDNKQGNNSKIGDKAGKTPNPQPKGGKGDKAGKAPGAQSNSDVGGNADNTQKVKSHADE